MLWILFLMLPILQGSEIKYTMYSNSSSLLPEPMTEKDNINFFLLLRDGKRQELKINDSVALLRSGFNFNVSTKVIIHGWISSNNTAVGLSILHDAYLKKSKDNLIVVDWMSLANGQYRTAKHNSKIVSKVVLEFFRYLVPNGVSVKQMHLVGHCIGAHIAGAVGKHYREHENSLLDAITGLDPAYPGYKFCSEEQFLSKYDARLVEIIHTNLGYWGYGESIGHIDFYPNGGRYQPGCMHDVTEICAHDRAVWYYAYTITSHTPFAAVKCVMRRDGTWAYGRKLAIFMGGLELKHGREGTFYLLTESDEPYVYKKEQLKNYMDVTEPYKLVK